MATSLVGSRIKRREDPRLIMGRGTFVDDIQLPRMTYAAILRSPYAHARIRGIDVSKAKALPGVVAVMTGADLQGKNVPCGWTLPDIKVAPHPALAVGKVRYTGDAVAVVVAEERYIARDALDLIEVDFEPLPVVVDAEKAIQPGAPQLHDEVPNNTTFVWKVAGGDIDKAFREAEVVVKERIVNQRLIPNAIEPRGMVAAVQPRQRPSDSVDRHPNPASGQALALDGHGYSRAQDARHRARGRRWIWIQALPLS